MTSTTPTAHSSTTADNPHLSLLDDVSFSPIFIMGDHRSGTTLLYQMLSSLGLFNTLTTYHVLCYDELIEHHRQDGGNQARDQLSNSLTQAGADAREIDRIKINPNLPEEYGFILLQHGHPVRLTDDSLPFFDEICRKVQFVSDPDKPLLLKNPWDFGQVTIILDRYPDARFLFLHRDPVDVINSKLNAIRTLLDKRVEYTAMMSPPYAELYRRPAKLALARMLFSSRWKLGARFFLRESKRLTDEFLDHIETIPTEKYIAVSYPELCEHPERTMRMLLNFLDFAAPDLSDCVQMINPRQRPLSPAVEKLKPTIHNRLARYYSYLKKHQLTAQQVTDRPGRVRVGQPN